MPRIATGQLPDTLKPLWDEWISGGMTHPEIERRQRETRSIAGGVGSSSSIAQIDYWQFVDDAIRGVGGFLDGSYIFPHPREVKRDQSTLKKKAFERIEMAIYDNFTGVIAEAPWIHIARASDMIKRDPQEVEGLDEFWADVDGRKTAMLDFLEFPFMQARAYGTGFVRVDRPVTGLRNESENRSTPITLHAMPTSAFKWWTLDQTGNLTALLYCFDRPGYKSPALYLWSLEEYAALLPTSADDKENYSVEVWGRNPLADSGRIPFARLHDGRPAYGEALGNSIMLNIAKIGRDVLNADSELIELRRKTALTFLGIPLKNATAESVNKLEIGTASAVPYDGDGGEPKWIAPELESMTKIQEYREKKKEQAFGMAHMAALSGYIQTSSGFHAEVEADKTNTRIARSAASLEAFETELLSLWAAYRGVEFGDPAPTVEYPREFGIRDLDKLTERTQAQLNMNLGPEADAEILRTYYQALYPRKGKDDIERMAQGSAQARAEHAQAQQESAMTPQDRAKRLIRKVSDSGNSARSDVAGRDGRAA